MRTTICAIPGDGIGREVVPAAVAVLRAAVPDLEVAWAEAGYETWSRTGEALPAHAQHLATSAAATLFGAVSSPLQPTPGYQSAILLLRRRLDLYACVRPVRSLTPGPSPAMEGGEIGHRRAVSPPRHDERAGPAVDPRAEQRGRRAALAAGEGSPVDLIVVRENTEGLYGGGEESDGERAVARRVVTRVASLRIARLAFDTARRLGRKRVTIVHKATVLPQTCGLFRATAFEVARGYPEIAVDEMLVDNAALRLAAHPEDIDIVVTTNLFGDILSDVASMHGGGLGLAPSANIGDRAAVFEPVHGSAPDIAASPTRLPPSWPGRCCSTISARATPPARFAPLSPPPSPALSAPPTWAARPRLRRSRGPSSPRSHIPSPGAPLFLHMERGLQG